MLNIYIHMNGKILLDLRVKTPRENSYYAQISTRSKKGKEECSSYFTIIIMSFVGPETQPCGVVCRRPQI